MEDPTIYAIGSARTNAELIAREVVPLGYLREEDRVLDPTYGLGNWWTKWRPAELVGTDLNPKKTQGPVVDFTALPFPDDSFDVVAFDPPYRLNGTPDLEDFDEGYGIEKRSTPDERMGLAADGLVESLRVAKRHVLMKCQDQVVSGKVRWQTFEFHEVAMSHGARLVDHLILKTNPRKQPAGRRQVHARRNYSSMLVFEP